MVYSMQVWKNNGVTNYKVGKINFNSSKKGVWVVMTK